jgi:hypothetical protein
MTQRDELSPLSVLLQAMRNKWDQGDADGAVAIARTAAPYVHARYGNVTGSTHSEPELNRLSDAELAERLAEARRRVFNQESNPDQPARLGD